MRISPDQGQQFAQMLVQDEEPLADITQVMALEDCSSSRWSLWRISLSQGQNVLQKNRFSKHLPFCVC